MKLSARNQLPGTVTKITDGAVNGIVTLDVNGTPVTATISLAAIRELGLEVGKKAYAVKVMSVERGAVNSIVRLSVLKGLTVSATISNNAVDELGLESGKEALAVIKATSVMIGIDD